MLVRFHADKMSGGNDVASFIISGIRFYADKLTLVRDSLKDDERIKKYVDDGVLEIVEN